MNAWHFYARYYNFGDHALGYGVRRVFARNFQKPLIFKVQDVHSFNITKSALDEINRTADLLLVGGGGLIYGVGHTKYLEPIPERNIWMFKIPDELVADIQIPLVVFGVGYNQFRNQDRLHPEIVHNLKLVKEKSVAFSVRNDQSKAHLEKYQIDCDEVPDPGFFLDDDYHRPKVDGDYAVVQIAYDAPKERQIDGVEFAHKMSIVCKHILDLGYRLVFCPHCKPDIKMSKKIMSMCDSRKGIYIWDYWETLRDELLLRNLGYYKHAHFVIAMRGHAQIIPFGMEVPFLTIANHRKHEQILGDLGFSHLLVDVNEDNFVEKCISVVDLVLDTRDQLVATCKNKMRYFNGLVDRYIQSVSSLVC